MREELLDKLETFNKLKDNDDGDIPVFLIRVNYKSGIHEEMWVSQFDIDNGTYTWKSLLPGNTPLLLNVNAIESVWQLEVDFLPKELADKYKIEPNVV